MKSDALSGLLNAHWPVLLVSDTGLVLDTNVSAITAFGPALVTLPANLTAIWVAQNQDLPVKFLAKWEASKAPFQFIQLMGKDAAVLSFHGSLCAFMEDGKKSWLLQLLPEIAPKANSLDAGLAHKQKLDCALQLARTVSLDFNNALTSILGHTSLVLSKMEPSNPWRNSLMEVEKSAAKAAEIANDLGAFSRVDKETRAQPSGNLNLLLQRNAEAFQSTTLDPEITWTLELERKLYSAKFDEAKMQQALVKLMENAIESLGPQGRIKLQTKNLELTEPTQDRNAQLAAGTYVCAEITDNGCGIETDILPRIFEPFFTTKRDGKHRGLGLAWVYGIVTNHGGSVAVSSQVGIGTSVRVYLPASKTVVKESADATDLNGTETILMVDDEDLLLTMGQTVLSHFGYRVLTANTGAKALELIAQSEHPIDLVITDLVMPAMSGRELVEHVRRLSPQTRILCCSGFVHPQVDDQQQTAYLQKPFTSQDLLLKVKRALAPEPAPVD